MFTTARQPREHYTVIINQCIPMLCIWNCVFVCVRACVCVGHVDEACAINVPYLMSVL